MKDRRVRLAKLRVLVGAAGGPAAFARAHPGIDQTYISQLLNAHRSFGEKAARKMEGQIGKPEGWLDQQDQVSIPAKAGLAVTKHTPHPMASMARQGLHAVADADDQAITVPVFDVAASCGTGTLQPDHEPIIDFVRLSRAWVQRHLVFTAPANLAVISAHGDSMEPTFGDGDILLVDTGVTEIRLDAIYMLECKGELFIKRIQRRISGAGHIMVSDNQSYRDQEIDMKRIKVLGRVIWAWNGRKL